MTSKLNVVIDDAGSLKPETQEIIKLIAEGHKVGLIYDRSCLAVPIETCIYRDSLRANPVGADVIRSFEKYLPN